MARSLLRGTGLIDFLMRESSFACVKAEDDGGDEDEHFDDASNGRTPCSPRKWIREFSALANVVASRCARILLLSVEELQRQFNDEIPEFAKASDSYARNLLEYCCLRALGVLTSVTDCLSDKDFRQLTFDMMLAWEAPGVADKPIIKVGSGRSVGEQAFVRLGPAIIGVADPVTVHSQFALLTATSDGRLQFTIYAKYLAKVNRIMESVKNQSFSSHFLKFRSMKCETLVEFEGTVKTPPVLQHTGVSIWPGRMTLTDHALYFEPIGVGSYDNPLKFDFSDDSHHTVKPELTGPWGARLFDRGILCKSSASPEPLIFEFPEIMGHSRRDYWLAIIRELVCVHQLIRKYQMEDVDKVEALSRALLGIVRLQATRELVHGLPFKFESLLTFLTCEHLHGGDLILKAIAKNFSSRKKRVNGRILQRSPFSAISANSVSSNPATSTNPSCVVGTVIPVGEFLIGDLTPLEKAVLQSRGNAKLAELAQSTIASVKMGGIDTNLAVMKELSLPFIHAWEWIRELQSWNDPLKTITFLLICSYILLKNYHGYVIPVGLICFSGSLLWIRQDQGKNAGDVNVLAPSPNAMEQLFNLQQALFDLENNLRMGNISLLKVRAILFSRVPQVMLRRTFLKRCNLDSLFHLHENYKQFFHHL
ncbi:hypothetical protein KP509_13G007100 [Ceratopteris richardii]|uniref:Uncharacterized protein n=1 Tax=Ceratopteris richardii TaxID=49495 RepID=A0A8T2TF18_CERRI|nr:hypothetical protein KP509_13G007100 [Ceratopteris richardii]